MTDKDYDTLFEMLQSVTFKKRREKDFTNRRNFPDYRGACFGIIRPRFKKGGLRLSRDSKKFPQIHEQIFKIGKALCDFEFSSVQLNKCLVCPRHVDSRNGTGETLIVSIGDYHGGLLIIEGMGTFCTNRKPITFDATKLYHYNTEIESGTKYSLVFYKCKVGA